MNKEQAEAYIEALEHERSGYAARDLDDRVKAVDAEIKRVKDEFGSRKRGSGKSSSSKSSGSEEKKSPESDDKKS